MSCAELCSAVSHAVLSGSVSNRWEATSVGQLTTEQLHWLLDGIDIDAVRRHPAPHYHHTS